MSSQRYFLITSADGKDKWLSKWDDAEEGATARPATARDLTPDRVAAVLDQDAESANNHGFVGCHTGLLKLLWGEGVEATVCRNIMLGLLMAGGLPGIRRG